MAFRTAFFVLDRLVLLDEVFAFAEARGALGLLSCFPVTVAAALLAASAARLAISVTLWAAPVMRVLAMMYSHTATDAGVAS